MTQEALRIRLHSFAGVYENPPGGLSVVGVSPDEPIPVAFGGYFKENTDTKGIQGELVDIYGQSTIEGTLTEEKLEFTKRYTDRGVQEMLPAIEYKLIQEETEWRGTYSFVERDLGKEIRYEGNAYGQTSVLESDAEHILAGPLKIFN